MIKQILMSLITLTSLTGCLAPPVRSSERVVVRAVHADTKLALEKIESAVRSLTRARSDVRVAIEIHARGKACRVAITGGLKEEEANAIGVATLNILSMYFLDFLVTINERIFRISGSMRPDDGTV